MHSLKGVYSVQLETLYPIARTASGQDLYQPVIGEQEYILKSQYDEVMRENDMLHKRIAALQAHVDILQRTVTPA